MLIAAVLMQRVTEASDEIVVTEGLRSVAAR
jgi:hypothetical protein